MPGRSDFLYPWPYTEGLAMDEAMNELAFIATGLYGKPIPKQNGAPLRLVAPWKYGFKNVKSIVSVEFTDKRPVVVLGEAAGQRIRLLGQREPAGAPSALEPGDREAAGQRRAASRPSSTTATPSSWPGCTPTARQKSSSCRARARAPPAISSPAPGERLGEGVAHGLQFPSPSLSP